MTREEDHLKAFDASILGMFATMGRKAAARPRVMRAVMRAYRHQRGAARRRRRWGRRGVHVPAFAILSVTRRCNLSCTGCYAGALHRSDEPEMSAEKLRDLLGEMHSLGVSIVLLAGGEPLARRDLLEVTEGFPRILFPLFTNGTLIDDEVVERLSRQRNIVPILSLEGDPFQTDGRRGAGVHEKVLAAMDRLAAAELLFGTSITLTRENFDTVTREEYVRGLIERMCRVFFYISYVPAHGGTEDLVLTEPQAKTVAGIVERFRERFAGWFLAFPGGEEEFGGCLAAGRGFVHINAQGQVEPCPFSPFSDASLQEMSVRAALSSPLLRVIREHGGELQETAGGCTLWENREWVAARLAETNARVE
ncbi:MAG: radical SAM protein [Candidatus Bipolaricaulota bacterium]|nr:MAG: radical SAM protein [Candidatus Bipolaricaulota bacterium]